jgi:transposase
MVIMTRERECSVPTMCLLLAFELGKRSWKLGFSAGIGQRPRVREIRAGEVGVIENEVVRAKMRLGLPLEATAISCYEAGRDGFWLHRDLVAQGITNHVVDSSSIEVNRRARRVWRVVNVPTVTDEDARHLPRTWETLAEDRTRLINRLKGLLITQGVQVPIDKDFLDHLNAARLWDGTAVPPGLQERLAQDWAQLRQIETLLREQKARAARPLATPTTGRAIEQLQTLRAIGVAGAWVLATEIFGWRQIKNRRQLGALVGLVPAPYKSGETEHDQGITRAGNVHVRRVMVQLAWGWLRYQPESALTQWISVAFGGGGKRLRRIGIVALARKLLVALWRYLETGAVPDGAQLKPTEV